MANRHGHKQERAEARRLAAETGEGYQRALARLRARNPSSVPSRRRRQGGRCSLIALTYLGRPATLATFEFQGRPVLMLVPHPFRGQPFPAHPLHGWTTFGGEVLA